MPQDVFDQLEWRGLVHQVTDPSLREQMKAEPFTLYCGFDPTAPSLTTAHLMQILSLRRMQIAGHTPVAVAGGGTGLIGDPSFKESERPLLSKEEIESNVEQIRAQLARLLDFEAPNNAALLVNNADWLTKLPLTDFLREVGKHFSVNTMIARDSVRARLEDREQGISFTEFSYMLLQSYDFLHLFDSCGCRLQIGGSDQWGNIVAGADLIRRKRAVQAFGLTSPLIVRADGKKMSKSEGGAVWLDGKQTSPYAFYQYWFNTADADVGTFLRYYTFLDSDEIEDLQEQVATDPSARVAQRKLASEVTAMLHGEGEVEKAAKAAKAFFGEEIAGLDEKTLLDVLADAPSFEIARSALGASPEALVDIAVTCGLFPSKGAARTDIQGGGFYLNNRRVIDPGYQLSEVDLLQDRYLLLRRGKKTHLLVRLV